MDFIKGIRVWPFTSLSTIIPLETELKPSDPLASPYNKSLLACINSELTIVSLLILTYGCNLLDPIEGLLVEAERLEWTGWILRIFLRDLFLMLCICGGWHHILYASSYTRFLLPVKFNKKYPENSNLWREVLFSVSTTAMGTGFEVLMLHLYATKRVTNYYMDLTDHPISLALWLVLMPAWREGHFYIIHRFMHPWRTRFFPDVGKFLYNHVHSLHHKSYNPSSWSGISMHPVQGFLYETACVIPCFFLHHPLMVLLVKFHLNVLAQIGHDGYDSPGSGSYFHYLHHAHFECNYGTENLPFDWLFGTFEDGSKFKEKKEVKG